MNREQYWVLIERTRAAAGGDSDAQVAALTDALAAMTAEEIVSFEQHTSELLAASYDNRLWGAAYLINGGCSDDGFDYFRGWLVAQGRAIYQAALADPDSLAECEALGDGDVELDALWYLASRAYEAKTGQPLPDDVGESGEAEESEDEADDEEVDFDFDDDEAMQKHYPRLWARFCAPDDA